MTIHRFAAKRDHNEAELVAMAEKLGAMIVKEGPLDLWLWHPKTGFVPVEVKSPRGQYTQAQKKFLYLCELNHAPHLLWRTESDVLACLGAK